MGVGVRICGRPYELGRCRRPPSVESEHDATARATATKTEKRKETYFVKPLPSMRTTTKVLGSRPSGCSYRRTYSYLAGASVTVMVLAKLRPKLKLKLKLPGELSQLAAPLSPLPSPLSLPLPPCPSSRAASARAALVAKA